MLSNLIKNETNSFAKRITQSVELKNVKKKHLHFTFNIILKIMKFIANYEKHIFNKRKHKILKRVVGTKLTFPKFKYLTSGLCVIILKKIKI